MIKTEHMSACFQAVFSLKKATYWHRVLTHSVLINLNSNIAIGKYLVSPLSKRLDDGRYAASVSIRSGRGSGTHDRVMRFTPVFCCDHSALNYATQQGLIWVNDRNA